jgi:hypothetical protein
MNLHDDAIYFVRRHNCANHTPVELIEEAMNIGAMAAMARMQTRLDLAVMKLDELRKAGQPHQENRKPIDYENQDS